MADNFGLKIGVEGEKEFKNALRDINQSFKVLGSEMKLVESEFSRQDKSIESLTAKNQVLNKEIDTQKDKISTLERALANASESFGENDRRTQAWVIQLNNAKAELNGMERELSQNENAINELSDEFKNSENSIDDFEKELKEVSETAEDSSSKFDKLGGVLKGVGAALAVGVTAIGAAAVSAGKALTDMAVSSAAYADEMITQSSVTGMSVESLQAYSYAADLVDVSLDTLTGSMAKQVKSMSSARDGSASMSEAYDKLGVAVANSDGTLRDSETVYWETIDALGKMQDGAERDALAMQIFGKSAQDLNPLIAQGSEGIAQLTDEAIRMGAVLSEDTIAKLGQFDDSVQRLKQGSEAAQRVIGTILLPQLQTLADEGVTLLGDFTKGIVDAQGDFDKISEVIGNTVGGIVNMIAENLPNLVQVGLDIVMSIGGAIVDNLPIIVDSAVQIVMNLLQGLIEALPQITDGALQLLLALVNGLIENLPMLVEAALQMVVTLATGIAEALPELIPAIVETVLTIVNTLLENMDKILEAAFQIIVGLAEGLINSIPTLIEALPQIIESFVAFFIANLPKIIELGVTLNLELTKGIIKAIPQLVASLPQIIVAIVKGLTSGISQISGVGKSMVEGLWEGIKSMKSWITNKVQDFFSGIVSGVKSMLKINSPSKVFAEIGGFMGEGVGVGFVDAMNNVERDMQKAIPTTFDVNTSLNTVNTSETNSFGGGSSNQPFTLKIENFINNRSQDVEQLAYELEFYRQRVSFAKGGV